LNFCLHFQIQEQALLKSVKHLEGDKSFRQQEQSISYAYEIGWVSALITIWYPAAVS